MNHPRTSTARALAALLAMAALAAPSALASHMTTYAVTTEHDDVGRSNEPDNAVSSVLAGMVLSSCNVDDNLDGVCEVHSPVTPNPVTGVRVIAPGCWDDAGRRPSGPCFATLTAGAPIGMSGNRAPGAFTTTKGDPVRFLDTQVFLQQSTYVEFNHKMRDSGLGGALALLGAGSGTQVLLGPQGIHAWYGTWTDLNGNGVLDHSDDENLNEFQWRGSCINPTTGNPVAPHICAIEPLALHGWAWPGNHHAFIVPDTPGLQLVCFADFVAGTGQCAGALKDFDTFDENFFGDPLLGPQGGVRPDFGFIDRTWEAFTNRQYIAGNGFAFMHYDQSVLVREDIIVTIDAPVGGPAGNDPRLARFRDVDRYESWNPLLGDFLQATVKPAARGAWVSVRDSYDPINRLIDGRVNSHATGLGLTDGPLGTVDDAAVNPGWGHEPNFAGDLYPGAVRGACSGTNAGLRTFMGFCNNYAGSASRHAFADMEAFRSVNLIALRVGDVTLPLVFGPLITEGNSQGGPAYPRDPAQDHRRSLGPGIYDFLGVLGVWQDKAHFMADDGATDYTVPRDGWVGNIVNSTGQFRYRDYFSETCTLYGVSASYEFALCHPYADGTIDDPQSYNTNHGEWTGQCTRQDQTLTVSSTTGVWAGPVFVWRNMERTDVLAPAIEDWTGRSGSIELNVECNSGTATTTGTILGRDMLVLPSGNVGFGVTSTFVTAPIDIGAGVTERVTDVDRYDRFA